MHVSRLIAVLAGASLMAGCAVNHQALGQYGQYELDGNLLKSFSVEFEGKQGERLAACTASNTSNDSVSLSDSSVSFIGPYSGNLYHGSTNREAGGGSVMQYVSSDGREVVAKGTVRYSAALIERAVRFTLTAKQEEGSVKYRFGSIQQAQLATGYATNSGFSAVPATPGAGVDQAMSAMKALATEIHSCL